MKRRGFTHHTAARKGSRTFLAAVLAAVFTSSLPGQQGFPPSPALTLEQAAALALENHPLAEAAEAGLQSALYGRREAESRRWPRLSLSEVYTHGNNPVFAFGSLLEQGRFGPQNFAIDSLNNPGSLSNFRTSLDLALPLLQRRALSSAIGQARSTERVAELQIEQVRQQLRLATVEAFFGVIVARQRLEVARQAVQTARREEERVASLVQQGLLVSSDLLASQAQRAEFEQQAIATEGALAVAMASLNTVLGRPPAAPVEPAGELPARMPAEPPLEPWLAAALEERFDLAAARALTEQARLALHAARGQWQPSLSLFAQYGASSHDLSSGSSDFTVGARLALDLFDQGRPARVSRAVAEVRAAEALERQRQQEASLEIIEAYQQLRAARQQLEVTAAAVSQAAETLRIVRDRHEVGLTTITELLRSQTALLGAQTNRIEARYQQTVSYARLLERSGRLTDLAAFLSGG